MRFNASLTYIMLGTTHKVKETENIICQVKNAKDRTDKTFILYTNNKHKPIFLDIHKEIEEINDDSKSLFEHIKEKKDVLERKTIILDKKKESEKHKSFVPTPNFKDRDISIIIGPSGAGKSTYIANYIGQYNYYYPSNEVHFFSDKTYTEAIDGKGDKLTYIQYDTNNEEVAEILDLDNFANSLIIVDDVLCIRDARKNKSALGLAMKKFIEDVMSKGREMYISILVTQHIARDGFNNKMFKTETKNYVLFPHFTRKAELISFLKTEGVEQEAINDIYKNTNSTRSRWVNIRTKAPFVMFSSKWVHIY